MQPTSDRSADRGFTLVELLVVLAILILAVTLAVPPLWNMIVRSKLEGAARELSQMIQRGRLEAVRRSAPVVIGVNPDTSQFFAFVDRNDDGIYNPVAGQPTGATDFALEPWSPLRPWSLPDQVSLAAPEGQQAFEGLTTKDPDQIVVLLQDGSVRPLNPSLPDPVKPTLRFGDARGNFLEVCIDTPATARVTVRKWDGTGWWARGEGGHPWEWN